MLPGKGGTTLEWIDVQEKMAATF